MIKIIYKIYIKIILFLVIVYKIFIEYDFLDMSIL